MLLQFINALSQFEHVCGYFLHPSNSVYIQHTQMSTLDLQDSSLYPQKSRTLEQGVLLEWYQLICLKSTEDTLSHTHTHYLQELRDRYVAMAMGSDVTDPNRQGGRSNVVSLKPLCARLLLL